MKRELLNFSKTNSDSILHVVTGNTGRKVKGSTMLADEDYEEDEDYSDMHPNETVEEFLEHENYIDD